MSFEVPSDSCFDSCATFRRNLSQIQDVRSEGSHDIKIGALVDE